MREKTFGMRAVGKGGLIFPMILFVLMFFSIPSQATIVNPLPGAFGADDGTELFDPCQCMAALEGYDLFDQGNLPGSTFGFFYWGTDLSDPNNLITLFDPTDEIVNGHRPKATVDFVNGIVYDVDANEVQDNFTPLSGYIGFFYDLNYLNSPSLFTVASLNPGGVDAAATFPHLTSDNAYLIGYEVPDLNLTLAFEVIRGITPVTQVPEPGTLYLIGAGLLLVAFLSRTSFSGSGKSAHRL